MWFFCLPLLPILNEGIQQLKTKLSMIISMIMVKMALLSLRIFYLLHSFYFNQSQKPSTVIWEQQALIGWDPGRPAQTWAGCRNRENMTRYSSGTHCKSPCGRKQFSCWTKLKHSSSNSKEPGWLFRALCCSAFSYFTFPLLLQLFRE